MNIKCPVSGCISYIDPRGLQHTMPTDTETYKKWIDSLQLTNVFKSISSYKICHLHFKYEDYVKNESGRRTELLKTAVPSLMLPKRLDAFGKDKRVRVIKRLVNKSRISQIGTFFFF